MIIKIKNKKDNKKRNNKKNHEIQTILYRTYLVC